MVWSPPEEEDSLLKSMISGRIPCSGAPPNPFSSGGALMRGRLARDEFCLEGMLALENVLGENIDEAQ
jgi:hypothetical protein